MSADASPFTGTGQTRGYSTLVVEEVEDGEWRVTQAGVDVVGHGASAPLAAAEYCEQVAEVGDGDD